MTTLQHARVCPPAWLGLWRSRSGVPVRLRPIRPDDAGRELDFLDHLSEQSRYQRLLSPRRLLPGELHRLVHIDYASEMALVAAMAGPGGSEIIIGVARYVALPNPSEPEGRAAEFAIVVADAWQRAGLGTVLLASLMHVGAHAGLDTFTGMALAQNAGIIALARKLGLALRRVAGDAVLVQVTGSPRRPEVERLQRIMLLEAAPALELPGAR